MFRERRIYAFAVFVGLLLSFVPCEGAMVTSSFKVGARTVEFDPEKVAEEYRWREEMGRRAEAGDEQAQEELDRYAVELEERTRSRWGSTQSAPEKVFELTPQQEQLLLVPENLNVFNAGSRGSGKTRGAIYAGLRHCEQYGDKARVWVLRKSYPGLQDIEAELRVVIPQLFPGASYNGQRHQWRLPNGATIELRCYESERSFPSVQGRNCTCLIVDEAQQWGSPLPLDLARSCLRGPVEVPTRAIVCANPAGAGGDWIFRRYFAHGAPDGMPFQCPDSGTRWTRLHSTFEGNQFIGEERYRRELKAACAGDLELYGAWVQGDFSVLRGSYFGSVISNDCQIGDWTTSWRDPTRTPDTDPLQLPDPWLLHLAFDFGVSRPSCALVIAWSPGAVGPDGVWYPRDSRIVLDEWTDARLDEGRLNEGSVQSIGRQAAEIKLMAARWRCEPRGVADPSLWSATGSDQGSVADQFEAHELCWEPAPRISRVAGWSQVRELLQGAGELDKAGLYINVARCPYLWVTVVHAPRDTKKPDDVDTGANDHAIDALRYGVIYEPCVEYGSYEFRR